MFDYNSFDLPVADVIPEVQQKLSEQNTLIVQAPPGAGKSTLLPLALLEEVWLSGKKILMLEPRRLAAKSIAQRMSQMLGEPVGETVGYRVRFETKVSANTKIEVLTEGILTRVIHSDNSLEGVGLIIFDEFHERSIHADVAMALTRETQQVLRDDLKLMVMSATLDMPKLSEMLNAKVVLSEGRQYPVQILYAGDSDEYMIPELTARTVQNAVNNQDGDVLVFLPGQGEIRKCEEILRKSLKDFRIHPLYGQLPFNKQQQAILPDKNGQRKVVLATSIAETSLTIQGIKIVVDSGYGRTQKFDPNSGLSRLETIQISKDSADQRAGRAGRLSEGVCYRMWSSVTQSRLQEHRVPEIEAADLASLVLDLAQWGVVDVNQMAWLSPPPKGHLAQASDVLHDLGALEKGKLTEHGKAVHKLPCHPRIAHMLLMAEEDDMLALATDIAALLEERDPLPKEAGIDINLRIEALRRFRKEQAGPGRLRQIEKIASQYRKLFDIEADNSSVDDYETGFLLAQGFPERIACARPGNNAQFQLANGKIAQASHKDDLANESWLAVANVNAREGIGRIFLASTLNPQDLHSLVKHQEIITWDTRSGGLIASRDMRIGNIVLKSTPLPNPDENHLVEAICDAVKREGERLLNFDEAFEQLFNRVSSLRKWNPDQNWPDFSKESLLMTCEDWLSPYLSGVKTPEQLNKLNIAEILTHSLEYEQQEQLKSLTPLKIEVPSGSQIKVNYQPFGAQPILAVRLQECFGLEDTPKMNNGKIGVLMHLLSPGFKPVQVTSDLKSFWENTYFEVKKELKRRYPKHSWPENPHDAEAVRGVKRKRG